MLLGKFYMCKTISFYHRSTKQLNYRKLLEKVQLKNIVLLLFYILNT